MSINPREIPTGAVRYNTDSNKMEVYIGSTWMEVAVSTPNLDGGTRGIFFGENPSSSNVIQFITIDTAGDATDFGDLQAMKNQGASLASRTRGIWLGGQLGSSPNYSNVIQAIEIASLGNAFDFGDINNIST